MDSPFSTLYSSTADLPFSPPSNPPQSSPFVHAILQMIKYRRVAHETSDQVVCGLVEAEKYWERFQTGQISVEEATQSRDELRAKLDQEKAKLPQFIAVVRQFTEVAIDIGQILDDDGETVRLTLQLAQLYFEAMGLERLISLRTANLLNGDRQLLLVREVSSMSRRAFKLSVKCIEDGRREFDQAEELISRHVLDLVLNWRNTRLDY